MTLQAIQILDPSVVGADIKPTESIGFARGRQSLDHSVWYNGSLLTFWRQAQTPRGNSR